MENNVTAWKWTAVPDATNTGMNHIVSFCWET